MFRQVSHEFGGEFLGDVELGLRVMTEISMENDAGPDFARFAIANRLWFQEPSWEG